jgi:hypothetical protein
LFVLINAVVVGAVHVLVAAVILLGTYVPIRALTGIIYSLITRVQRGRSITERKMGNGSISSRGTVIGVISQATFTYHERFFPFLVKNRFGINTFNLTLEATLLI